MSETGLAVQRKTTLLGRALRLRCPNCGHGDLFAAWVALPTALSPVQRDELRALAVELEEARAREPTLELLKQGGRHVLYFFCHGQVDPKKKKFFVVVGPDDERGKIESGDLDEREIHWPEDPDPLVFLNGCGTLAMLPETTNRFLARMRTLGAAGAIGTEIPVSTAVARQVACLVLGEMLAGRSIGEAFLSMRRELFRALSPLGLAYTFYAPSTLHFHAASGCAACRRLGLREGVS